MKYIDINHYQDRWMFLTEGMSVSDTDIHFILPIASDYATDIWASGISRQSNDPEHLEADNWLLQESNWYFQDSWKKSLQTGNGRLPPSLKENLSWDDDDLVYVMWSSESIIETIWAVFQRNWLCFLQRNSSIFLVNHARNEIVQFLSEGSFRIAKKPL